MSSSKNNRIISLPKNKFPKPLLEIPKPPEQLFVVGELPPEDSVHLCVVGARKYSPYGKEVCEMLIKGLRGKPVVIVSGLALGIDAIAHRSALENNLRTIAVPGSGLDPSVLYPASHKNLAKEIVNAGGCLLSEFDPTFKATPYSFPQRNRIMAGLSKAVLIIEAEQKSGTLITARLATDYNRDVLTVPGSIFSQNSTGPHLLLKIGATPITSAEDLLVALGLEGQSALPFEKQYADASAEELSLIRLLATPTTRDDLVRASGLPTQKVSIILSLMEIKGMIKESEGEIRLI
ncbi:MAG: DNA-processing protein DprA [Patescibacteria group bacterium]